MAVYTKLSKSDIEQFLSDYNVGELSSFKGIAEGVSNTNYLLTTTAAGKQTNYILTLFEQNFNAADLPFFLNLTTHLANKYIPCPHPIYNEGGGAIGNIKGKPAVLIEFLHGRGNPHITPRHLELVGKAAAELHLAVSDFPETRANELSPAGVEKIFLSLPLSPPPLPASSNSPPPLRGRARVGGNLNLEDGEATNLNSDFKNLKQKLESEFSYLKQNLPKNLPSGIVHADIFPDNVFFIDGNTDSPELSGIIDFYFSCSDFFIYDLMIILNAWCFDAAHNFVPERARALLDSYNKIRPLSQAEKEAMSPLARAAAMRFLCTRMRDYLNRTEGALVNIKDPGEYLKKLEFWQQGGWKYD